jgi:hypothetical protein
MINTLEEKISPSVDSEGGFSGELPKEEKEKLQHRERARTYYWRHRDRLREAAKDKYRTEQEGAERQRKQERGAFIFMNVSLVVAGAALIGLYLYERNQRLRQEAAISVEPAPPEEPSTYPLDIGGGRIIQIRKA